MVMGYAGAGSLVQLIRIVQLCKILLSTGARIYWCIGDALFLVQDTDKHSGAMVENCVQRGLVQWCNGARQCCETSGLLIVLPALPSA